MANKHPYISATGPLVQVIEQLRRAFPATVNADTLKKLGLAPNNESFVINILRFVGVIDEEGRRTAAGAKVFSQHDDSGFQEAFRELVRTAYSDLFEVRGDDAWTLERERLIAYFRSHDQSTALVGQRQASTFQALAAVSGHGAPPPMRKGGAAKPAKNSGERKKSGSPAGTSAATAKTVAPGMPDQNGTGSQREVGLTVRIEINLPAEGDQETYDRIFRSIRENLLNAG